MGRAARTEHLFTIAIGMQTQSVEHLGNRDALFGTVPHRFLPKNRIAHGDVGHLLPVWHLPTTDFAFY